MTEKEAFICLSAIDGIGPRRFKKLYQYFQNTRAILNANTYHLQRAGLSSKETANFIEKKKNLQLQNILSLIKKHSISTITCNETDYPSLLREISDPPFLIYTKAKTLNSFQQICLGIVGTRKITPYAKQVLDLIIPQLVKQNITIVSGLAFGVDAYAHRKTIECGGQTIAVLPTGLDCIYPATHQVLANNIIKTGGLLLSELSPQTPFFKGSFVRRNRLISGISQATLVIEAGKKSGSLITANFALDQNRDVMTIPGNIFTTQCQGTNHLAQQGAIIITNAEEILETLKISPNQDSTQKTPLCLSPDETLIYDLIHNKTMTIDDIIKNSDQNISQINQIITSLEIKGVIQKTSQMKYITT